jgi:hypothetical protein
LEDAFAAFCLAAKMIFVFFLASLSIFRVVMTNFFSSASCYLESHVAFWPAAICVFVVTLALS